MREMTAEAMRAVRRAMRLRGEKLERARCGLRRALAVGTDATPGGALADALHALRLALDNLQDGEREVELVASYAIGAAESLGEVVAAVEREAACWRTR